MKSLENQSARVILKKARGKSVVNFHPWIYSGAVDKIAGELKAGDIVPVVSQEGQFLAKGFYNPHSQIRVRILTFQDEPITEDFFLRRFSTAIRLRQNLIHTGTNACRLIHGDGDFLSGLVVDKYGSALVMQMVSLGMMRLRSYLVEGIRALLKPEVIVERSEGSSVAEEGMSARKEILWGSLPAELIITENKIRYQVDIWNGQKTGFFLDQRDNRKWIGRLAAGKKVLNCFSYSGGFSVSAALRGAQTTSVETSKNVQEIARRNFQLNGLDVKSHRFLEMDAFEFFYDNKERYEIVILDPPAFVKKRSHLAKGSRAYKEINRLAMHCLEADGLLLTCSCSSHVDWSLFQKILFAAAQESGRRIQIIGRSGPPVDHPVSIYHPEGEYLKTFLLRVQ